MQHRPWRPTQIQPDLVGWLAPAWFKVSVMQRKSQRKPTRTSSRKILLTGFEVFGSLRVNPAEKIVRRIAESSRRKGESDLIVAVLPTEYARAGHQIRQLIRRVRPKAVLCLGVARSRTAISLERIALNLDDDPLPDNAGRVYTGRHIALAG